MPATRLAASPQRLVGPVPYDPTRNPPTTIRIKPYERPARLHGAGIRGALSMGSRTLIKAVVGLAERVGTVIRRGVSMTSTSPYPDGDYPIGRISMSGRTDANTLRAGAPRIAPGWTLEHHG